VGTRATQTSVDTIDDFLDTEIAAIKAKTDALPSDPADASDISTSFGTVNTTLATIAGYLDTEIAAIKAKTDNLPASPAAVGSPMTLATAAITAATFQDSSITAAAFAEGAIGSAELDQGAIDEISAAVWEEATRSLTDKTGFSLTQAFPTNFASMAITAGGLVSLNLAQTGFTVRDLSAVADASLNVGDALVASISEMAGDESVSGTTYTKKTPAGTTTRIFTLDDAEEPTSRT
jgi:hypothetical protein